MLFSLFYNYPCIRDMKDFSTFNALIEKQLDQQVSNYFSDDELNQLAIETNFSERSTNKLSGSTFFKLLVFNSDKLCEQSLNDLCVDLSIHHEVTMRKQSLHESFNQKTLLFLKRALEIVLTTQISYNKTLVSISGFKRILIKDSTCFQIDKSLKEYYPGPGGSASDASIRI